MGVKDIPLRLGVVLLLLTASVAAQTKTTITDRVANLSSSPIIGNTLTIVLRQTMTTADGYVILQGTQLEVKVPTDGNFTIALPPNLGSTPSGTSYEVSYATKVNRFKETWIVPASASPVTLLMVRSLSTPLPPILIPFPQNIPPAACVGLDRPVPVWIGTQWDCGMPNIGTASMNLENPTAADAGKFQWKPKNSLTVTRVSCSTDQGEAYVNFDIRSESSPNLSGPTVLFNALACNSSGIATTEVRNASISSLAPVALSVLSVNGSPSIVRIHVEYKLNP